MVPFLIAVIAGCNLAVEKEGTFLLLWGASYNQGRKASGFYRGYNSKASCLFNPGV